MKIYDTNNITVNKNIEVIFDKLFTFTTLTDILPDMKKIKCGKWKDDNGVVYRKDILTLKIKNIPNEIIETVVDGNILQLEIKTTIMVKRDDYYKVKLDYNILNIKKEFCDLLNTDTLIRLFAIVEITKIADNKSILNIKSHITSYIIPLMNDIIEMFSYNYCESCVNKILEELQK